MQFFSCWLKRNSAFYASFCGPIATCLGVNAAILIKVTCSLSHRGAGAVKRQRLSLAQLLRALFFLSVLMGLTWTVGLLMLFDDSKALQYVFALLTTTHGFCLFLVHFWSMTETRKALGACLTREARATDIKKQKLITDKHLSGNLTMKSMTTLV